MSQSNYSSISPEQAGDRKCISSCLPVPGDRAPELRAVRLDNGQTWDLHVSRPERFTLIVFYRGVHCPICREQLEELEQNLAAFRERGIEVVAVSCDDEERARKSASEWAVDDLSIVFGLELDTVRDWGLFVSRAIGEHEPKHFCEPGMFLVDREGRLYAAWVQSVPFVRPALTDLLKALDFIRDKDYPARGTVAQAA
ncbi:peroxiredoxin-like family protein [Elongatibacter sediminis]|uniref:Peroxiredoxin-like family protein n=1 Tax=Elongatibacter sediminis TaxID=3119006 RepID=A0AAW9RBA1_9GAMM